MYEKEAGNPRTDANRRTAGSLIISSSLAAAALSPEGALDDASLGSLIVSTVFLVKVPVAAGSAASVPFFEMI